MLCEGHERMLDPEIGGGGVFGSETHKEHQRGMQMS